MYQEQSAVNSKLGEFHLGDLVVKVFSIKMAFITKPNGKYLACAQILVTRDPGGGCSYHGLTRGSGLFEGPTKDYQMAQFREITLPLGGILVVTTL